MRILYRADTEFRFKLGVRGYFYNTGDPYYLKGPLHVPTSVVTGLNNPSFLKKKVMSHHFRVVLPTWLGWRVVAHKMLPRLPFTAAAAAAAASAALVGAVLEKL